MMRVCLNKRPAVDKIAFAFGIIWQDILRVGLDFESKQVQFHSKSMIFPLLTPQEVQPIRTYSRRSENSDLDFVIVVCEKSHLKTYM